MDSFGILTPDEYLCTYVSASSLVAKPLKLAPLNLNIYGEVMRYLVECKARARLNGLGWVELSSL